MSETKSSVVLPPPQPMKAIKLSDMPRYTQRTNDQILPEQLEPMANEIIRLSMQGTSFASMAGRLGLLPDELRQLMITYPDMQRAMAYGQGLGSDEMTGVVFERGRAGDMTAALAWLKAKGGWSRQSQPQAAACLLNQATRLFQLI